MTTTTKAGTVSVQILAFNDFHGNLQPPSPTNGAVYAKTGDPLIANAQGHDNGNGTTTVQAGGVAFFAAHIAALKKQNPNTLIVSAGDLTGAAPLLSNEYADEPTVDVMNTLGLDYEGVGNHDFDHGAFGVLRFQNGGCDTTTEVDAGFGMVGSCEVAPNFGGAHFKYLAANVTVTDAGAAHVPDGGPTSGNIFPAYDIKTVGGAKIAFIGMTLHGTPSIVSGGLPGLNFADEVATANALVPVLKAQNVDAIVVLLHQGGFQSGTYNDCPTDPSTLGSDIYSIATGLDPAITLIHSAHTHVAYNCVIQNRPVAQAASFGRIITQYNLSIDTHQHKVLSAKATNYPVTRDIPPDPAVQGMVSGYLSRLAPLADTVVGYIAGDLSKTPGNNGEAPLGDVIADGMLVAANDYVTTNPSLFPDGNNVSIAFTNIGGIRDSLVFNTSGYIQLPDGGTLPPGEVTYQQTQAVEPFANVVDIIECTAAQIIAVIQQNVYSKSSLKLLQQSGLSYSWSAAAVQDGGSGAADPSSFSTTDSHGAATTLNPADTTSKYYVVGTTFITQGGDGYTAFKNCTQVATIGIDLDVFNSYLKRFSQATPVPVPNTPRVTANP